MGTYGRGTASYANISKEMGHTNGISDLSCCGFGVRLTTSRRKPYMLRNLMAGAGRIIWGEE
jgi:hypothetical protein